MVNESFDGNADTFVGWFSAGDDPDVPHLFELGVTITGWSRDMESNITPDTRV